VLLVRDSAHRLPDFESKPLTLAPQEVLDVGDIVLAEPARLEVRLRLKDGSPVREALVSLVDSAGRDQIVSLDTEGRGECGLLAGAYRLTIYGEGFPWQRQRIELRAGETKRLDLILPPAITFVLGIHLPDGEEKGGLVIRGPDGTVESEDEFERNDYPHGLHARLTLGAHVAELTCVSGRRYQASFMVAEQKAEHGKRPDPYELTWSPAR